MARNSLGKLDIINLALTRVGEGLICSFEDTLSEVQSKAVLCYTHRFAQALSMFPWPFATRRKRITPDPGRTGSKYDYVYTFPADVRFVWDLYRHRRGDTLYGGGRFVPSSVYKYISFPFPPGFVVGDEVAEEVDGRIESSYPTLWLFYTFGDAVASARFNQQFVDLMVNELEFDLSKAKNFEAERLGLVLTDKNRQRAEGYQDVSIADKKSQTMPEAAILQRLRGGY